MSPKRYENSMKAEIPLWTGEEPDPGIWDHFRFALQGYCGERGLSYLIRDEVKIEEVKENDLLMSIILRFTRGEAGKIVRPFAKKGDGTSAWRALVEHYGNECKDRRQARIIECAKMLEKIACRSKEDITTMVIDLDHIFSEFEELGCSYPGELKKVTLLTKLQPAAGEIYGCIIKDANMTYEETTASVRRMAAFDGAVDRANKRTDPELGVYHGNAIGNQKGLATNQGRGTRTKKKPQWSPKKGKGWTPSWDQCLWCLQKGHRYATCPEKLRGKPSRVRPDGTRFEDYASNAEVNTTSLLAQCLLAHVQPNKENLNPNPNPNSKTRREWLVDSGCNRHMTPHKEDFTEFVDDQTVCKFGNNETSKAKGRGKVTVECKDKNGNHAKIILNDVLYIPSLPHRMFSSGRLREKKGEFRETEGDSSITLPLSKARIPLLESEGFLWLCETRHGQHQTTNMTELEAKHAHKTRDNEAIVSTVYVPGHRESAQASMLDWHETLGHTHPASIIFLEQRGLIKVRGPKIIDDFNCRTCKEAKSTLPHYQRGTRSIKKPGEVVHVDLVGPFEPDKSGHRHMIVFIDEATRFKSVLGLNNKGDAYKSLKTYMEAMQLAGMTVECIRGDGAGELGRSQMFRQELKVLALRWETSPPYTHQQQGIVERAIRQIVGGRAQLARSGLWNDFWFHACQDYAFKSNCLPHQSLGGDSPYERLHPGRKPRYQALRKFDQTAYVHIDKQDEERLDLEKCPYGRILGKLMYLSHMTRPDICNAVRELGRHMHDPCTRHWSSLQHVIRYLATFPKKGISFKREKNQGEQLKGYSDADFAADTETRRSCAGYVLFLGKTPITWSSKTERRIALSTTESEWKALARGIRHGAFLKGFLNEIGFEQPRIPWFCDNVATIVSAKTLGFNGRTRHVDIELKFTRQEHE